MSIVAEAIVLPDLPYIDSITHGHTVRDGQAMRPAEVNWHMVVLHHHGTATCLLVGPWSGAGAIHYQGDAELLWIRFKVGVYMPHLLTRKLLDHETPLPNATGQKFWFRGATWQFPNHNNVDVFINRLVHDGSLAIDPLVRDALSGRSLDVSPRTLRHRFLKTVGVSQSQIAQVHRARHAESLLRAGTPILDVVETAGYYDQPHLTRALKQYIGFTPAQLLEQRHSG